MDYIEFYAWIMVAATFGVWAWMARRGEGIVGDEDADPVSSSASTPPVQCYECLAPSMYGRTLEECASACGMPV